MKIALTEDDQDQGEFGGLACAGPLLIFTLVHDQTRGRPSLGPSWTGTALTSLNSATAYLSHRSRVKCCIRPSPYLSFSCGSDILRYLRCSNTLVSRLASLRARMY